MLRPAVISGIGMMFASVVLQLRRQLGVVAFQRPNWNRPVLQSTRSLLSTPSTTTRRNPLSSPSLIRPSSATATSSSATRLFTAITSGSMPTSFDDGTGPFQITTPIYYVNDKPHIGHAYTSVGKYSQFAILSWTTCIRKGCMKMSWKVWVDALFFVLQKKYEGLLQCFDWPSQTCIYCSFGCIFSFFLSFPLNTAHPTA